jgi:hypothetical protein
MCPACLAYGCDGYATQLYMVAQGGGFAANCQYGLFLVEVMSLAA